MKKGYRGGYYPPVMKMVLSLFVILTMLCALMPCVQAYDMGMVGTFQTILSGKYHTAAIKADSSLWCWGTNFVGQVGDGTTENKYTPVKIMDNIAAVSAGKSHTTAIKTDGSLWCWGNNDDGQLGDGTTEAKSAPIKIMEGVATVSAGDYYTAAIKTDGSLWCWGDNDYGQLGDGTTENKYAPVKIMDNVAAVSAGSTHTAAIKTDGSLWTWGDNYFGQLGDGTTEEKDIPVKIMDNVAAVSTGGCHTAAIKTDSSLWCWGDNDDGQLGDGITENKYAPVKIMDNVAAVSAGLAHTAAIKTDGSLWTWGDNEYGQLGDGTTEDKHTPVKVMNGVMLSSGGGTNTPTANKSVTVIKNNKDMTDGDDEYVTCSGAAITVDGKEYKTDKKGKVNIPSSGSAEVSCKGYVTENIDLANIRNGDKIYLEKSGVNTPILKSVIVNGTDIRREKTTIPKNFSGSITAQIDWNGNTEYLTTVENGVSVWQMTNGSTGNISLGSEFNSSGDISIVIKTTNGYTVKKKLNLTTTSKTDTGENISVSFGDGFRNLGSGVIPYFDGMSFNFDIPNFPCEISVDGNKITGVFGVDVAEWGYENGFKDNKDGEWDIPKKQNAFKELSAIIKDTENQIKKKGSSKEETVKEYKKLTKKLGKSKLASKAKFGFDADISAVGYIEGTIDQNGLYISSGGIIVSAEAKVGVSGEGVVVVVIVPVPYNWEASLKGAIEAQLAIAQREVREQKLSPQGKLSGSLGLKIGGGPGLKKFHANIVGNGSLDPEFTFLSAERGFTLDATVGASLEFVVGRWEKPFELAKKTFHLYPKPKSKEAVLYSLSDAYDISDFELIGRDYLSSPQEFTANDEKIQLFSADTDTKTETTVKTNTYKVLQPQMLTLNGEDALLVWMDEDLSSSAINGTSLMYSYYNGSSWTQPQYVSKDGMGDYNPVLKSVGGKICLAWESVEEVPDENAGIEDMEKALEIRYAIYNKDTNSFENITRVTNNAYTDYLPQISDVNGDAVITWISNSENDSFSANNNYSVNYVSLSDGAVKTAASGISAVDSHCAYEYDGDISVSYIADTDGDISTNDDNEIFTAAQSGVTQITNDTAAQSALREYDGKLYYYNNGKLSVSENGIEFIPMGIALPNDKYIVINNGNTVCYTDGEGAVSEVYAYFYDETQGVWSSAAKLTELNSRISDISGYSDINGKVQLAFNKTAITGDFEENISDLFGQSDLTAISITPAYNASVEYANADCSEVVTDKKASISADVKNKGERTVTAVNVVLTDNNGAELLNETKDITILPGNTEIIELTYPIPEDFESFTGNIKVNIPNETDYDTKDNSYPITFDCVDISLDDTSYVKDESGQWIINAALSNKGLKEEQNIEICLISDDNIIDKKTVAELKPLESDIVTFENVNEDVEYNIKITESENETMLGNNDGYVFITIKSTVAPTATPTAEPTAEPTVEPTTAPTEAPTAEFIAPIGGYADKVEISKTITEDNKVIFTVTPLDGAQLPELTLFTAEYAADGKLIGVHLGKNTLTNGVLTITADLPESSRYKFMLWDKSNCPLIKAITDIYKIPE